MTDELIKQNAELYAELLTAGNKEHYRTIYTAAKEGYETGAHSRDEEIENLQIDMYGLQGSVDLWKGEAGKANSKIRKLEKELNKLRNPWISVEEMLPEEGKDILLSHLDGIIIRLGCATIGDINFIKNHIQSYTCWMPTPKPELKKGE